MTWGPLREQVAPSWAKSWVRACRRWQREYLPTLTTRTKWLKDATDVRVGELVLVSDSNVPRGHWPVGRVTRVFPGADGRVRVAEVSTVTGCYKRPVSRLCRLECDGDVE